MDDELKTLHPKVHAQERQHSSSHEKCLPKLNVTNSFHFYIYFMFRSVIQENYYDSS